MKSLIDKYNIPGPRYTSYPTVPFWDEALFSLDSYIASLQKSFQESNQKEGISVYIHLPFCEALCTFCACHKRITKNHSVEIPYLKSLILEWKLYATKFAETEGGRPIIKELHLGGGTPTFFSPLHLQLFLEELFSLVDIAPDCEFSFEGHPNNTSFSHLETLKNLQFNRVSFGVQDYDPIVQKAINRIQPFENVQAVTQWSRELGYSSISHDLVFGLPFQSLAAMEHSIRKTIELLPDRLAFYSYAHVPWIKGNGQRGFDENDLPSGEEKRKLYEHGKFLFQNLGYHEVGMDHFSLPHDSLYKSMQEKTIHRNFMGYTSSKTQVMVSLGMSAIGDSWYGFSQNFKEVERYQNEVNQGNFPIFRGHLLTEEDLVFRRQILNIMCHLETSWEPSEMPPEFFEASLKLKELENDGLIIVNGNHLQITEAGRPFTRNVAMAFDIRLMKNKPETRIFSMTI